MPQFLTAKRIANERGAQQTQECTQEGTAQTSPDRGADVGLVQNVQIILELDSDGPEHDIAPSNGIVITDRVDKDVIDGENTNQSEQAEGHIDDHIRDPVADCLLTNFFTHCLFSFLPAS